MPKDSGIKVVVRPTLKELEERHKKRLKEINDLETPNKEVAIFLDSWVHQNFHSEGGLVGGWLGLLGGGRWKKGKGLDTSAKILRDSGRLDASFLPFANNRNAGIGSDLPYAKIHEEGSTDPGDSMVQRRILPKKSEVVAKVTEILEEHVKDSLK